ncbi:MAG: hypothetical protein ACON38_02380 [Akkermansiaceae bacterium]
MVAFFVEVAYPAGAMKQFFVLLALVGFGLASCERHTWETSKEQGGPKASDSINLFKHEKVEPKEKAAAEPAEGGDKKE